MSALSPPRSVDFLGIGAAKSGTTWLATMLSASDEIYIPSRKELNYFNEESFEHPGLRNPNADRSAAWYLSQFRRATPGQLMGEFSPTYLWNRTAPARIREHNQSIRLLVILRDPVAALESDCRYRVRLGSLADPPKTDLDRVLVAEPYLEDRFRYGEHLARYYSIFPREQLLVLLHDDLVQDSVGLLESVFDFLGAKPTTPIDVARRINAGGVARYPRFNRLAAVARTYLREHNLERFAQAGRSLGLSKAVNHFRNQTTGSRQPLSFTPATRKGLRESYDEDIRRLAYLTGHNLEPWLEG